jgi:hypothetical protein
LPWLGRIFHAVHHQTAGLNLASAPFWPLGLSGRLTERVAAIIASALERTTHFVDLHSNPELAMPFTIVNWELCRDAIDCDEMARMPVDGSCWSFTDGLGRYRMTAF